MDSDKILREVGVRYKAIKNQDITKDAVIWYHEEDVKKAIDLALTLNGVIASVLCVDSESFGGLTKDRKYPLIKEDSIHYTIINDFGNEFWYLKKRFIKI